MIRKGDLTRTLCCIALVLAFAVPAQARIVVEQLHSQALQENLIGDTPDRDITIYLPPGYDYDAARRYPVVYLLHGSTSDPKEWLDGTYQGLDLAAALDQRTGAVEYIVVMPQADNRLGGSFYVNSAAFGQWEDFVATELVRFIDAHFRTQPVRQSRFIAGQSMGGFGALYLAGRHPGTFGHVYAMSPCCLGFLGDLAADSDRWRSAPRGWLRAMTVAFAPTPLEDPANKPGPLPFVPGKDARMQELAEVARTWQEFMPLYRLTRDPSPYRSLCSIGLEAGRGDEISSVLLGTRAFSHALTGAGIAHTLDEFDGGHTDRTRDRFENVVLPHFANVFAQPQRAEACSDGGRVEPAR